MSLPPLTTGAFLLLNKYWQVKENIQFPLFLPKKKNCSHKHPYIKKANNQTCASSVSFWHLLSDKHAQQCHRALEIFQTSMRNLRDSPETAFSHFLTHTSVPPLSLLPQQNGFFSSEIIFTALWSYDGIDWAAAPFPAHPLCGLSILRRNWEINSDSRGLPPCPWRVILYRLNATWLSLVPAFLDVREECLVLSSPSCILVWLCVRPLSKSYNGLFALKVLDLWRTW